VKEGIDLVCLATLVDYVTYCDMSMSETCLIKSLQHLVYRNLTNPIRNPVCARQQSVLTRGKSSVAQAKSEEVEAERMEPDRAGTKAEILQ